MVHHLVRATTGHPIITIVIVAAITVLALIPASKFTVESGMDAFLSTDDPDVVMAEHVKESFGEQDPVTVVVDCSNSDAASAEAYVESLVDKLREDDRWKNIRYEQDFSFVGEKGILYLPEEYLGMLANTALTSQMIEGLRASMLEKLNASKHIVSDNGKIYLINTAPNVNMRTVYERGSLLDDLGELIEQTKGEDSEYEELAVGFTGGMRIIDYEGDKMAFRDFYRTAGMTLILILALLFLSFRSLSIPLLCAIPLLIGIVWTMGVVFLIYDSIHILSVVFAALILGIGIDYCIHSVTRFTDEMEKHEDVEIAFEHTFTHTGKAIILGCLTTAAAFFSYYFADTEGLHQFGVIGATGLILTLVAVFVLLPALITIRFRFGKLKPGRARFNILGKAGSQVQRFAPVILVALLGLFLLFGIRAPNARLSENLYENMPTETETYRQLEKVKANFGYNPDYLTCLVESESELDRCVGEFQRADGVLKVESINDYLPANQDEKLELIEQAIAIHPELAAVPWVNVSPMSWNDLPESIREGWVSDGEFLLKITPEHNLFQKSYQQTLLSELREIHPKVTAEAVRITKLLDMVADDMIRLSSLTSGALFVIVYIGTRRRNPIYALLSLMPVAFGIVGLLATYDWFGATLNAFTISMMPLIIGIGIDSGIHIIHRYLEEGKGSLPQVVQRTGKAIFLTTATTCLAFSSFLFSSHPTLNSLALVPIIGIILCFFGAIIFLPALLRVTVDRAGVVSK